LEFIFLVILLLASDTVGMESNLITGVAPPHEVRGNKLELARVLLVGDDVASRLALRTILEAGGYYVDIAVCGAEALDLLDSREYELVLSGVCRNALPDGRQVLSYARRMSYHPATAIVNAYHEGEPHAAGDEQVCIHTEDISELLTDVAALIGARASRRARRRRI
jgi:CheY-like chemotaxis protein